MSHNRTLESTEKEKKELPFSGPSLRSIPDYAMLLDPLFGCIFHWNHVDPNAQKGFQYSIFENAHGNQNKHVIIGSKKKNTMLLKKVKY
ncbi:hypothetical protein TNIN_116281 [Trichonephila inaurata madagascariensis]|uniref:Uncharacterized protein n=1 Tax=Trichonephila inaurata madagascariensis TaxID=2747483 RepID=A0A8X6WTB8_9ARAC|nr:hypothetical protein TNIN_116281 [Trichonephila inaurata madagascariensis]